MTYNDYVDNFFYQSLCSWHCRINKSFSNFSRLSLPDRSIRFASVNPVNCERDIPILENHVTGLGGQYSVSAEEEIIDIFRIGDAARIFRRRKSMICD